jgi:hypothetical protein
MAPRLGHGYDAADELGAQNVMISVSFANTEGSTIPALNQYRQINILRDPLFRDVTFNLLNTTGLFVPNETVYKVATTRIESNASSNSGNTQVTTTTNDWRENLVTGANLVIKDTISNTYQFTAVASVVNSSTFNATSNLVFTSNALVVYLANTQGSALVTNVASSTINVTNCMPVFSTGDIIIGATSGAHAQINNLNRGGTVKTFDTFVQMYKYTGSLVHGTFIENETVYQGSVQTANAIMFNAGSNSGVFTLLTSNQMGVFSISNTIVGEQSTAAMTVSTKYKPEVIYGSGIPLYVENVNPVQRVATQTETWQVILNF